VPGFLSSPIDPEKLPAPSEIERALRSALRLYPDVDYITFSGNGEPTHHPRFPDIVSRVTAVRDELVPQASVAVLSNSAGAADPRILKSLECLDRPIMKLDAGNERLFVQVNRSHPSVSFEAVVRGLSELKHPNLTIQTILFSGEPDNSTDDEIDDWAGLIAQIEPSEVQIYTIQRSPATLGIFPLAKTLLDDIAARVSVRTGVNVRSY
jgi:wyosine [tRNA(Phe)-imidazoG37] synthetase (radical SAM superfamily)